MSELKAGKLAKLASRSHIVSLVISDVIHDPLEIIASGPTCLSLLKSSRYETALEIIRKYNLADEIPAEVMSYFNRGLEKSCDTNEGLGLDRDYRVFNHLIGSNRIATDAILAEIADQKLDYDVKLVLSNSVCGEAQVLGSLFSCLAFCLHEVSYSNNCDELKCSSTERLVDSLLVRTEQTLKRLSTENPSLGNLAIRGWNFVSKPVKIGIKLV